MVHMQIISTHSMTSTGTMSAMGAAQGSSLSVVGPSTCRICKKKPTKHQCPRHIQLSYPSLHTPAPEGKSGFMTLLSGEFQLQLLMQDISFLHNHLKQKLGLSLSLKFNTFKNICWIHMLSFIDIFCFTYQKLPSTQISPVPKVTGTLK